MILVLGLNQAQMGVLLENQWLEMVCVVNIVAKRTGLGENN